jgi:hypothetical protein
MLDIMREYGSEVSDMAMPPRKSYVQKASVVRQFRRWNPNFTEWFVHLNGKWIPKLGTDGEQKRRQEARLAFSSQRTNKKQKTSTDGCNNNTTTTGTIPSLEDVSTSPSPVPQQEADDIKSMSKGKKSDTKNLIAI